MDKNIEQIILLLQQGKQLPAEYQDILFPINHKEYELTYKDKTPKEQILSVGEKPQGVPFQVEKTFGEKQAPVECQRATLYASPSFMKTGRVFLTDCSKFSPRFPAASNVYFHHVS